MEERCFNLFNLIVQSSCGNLIIIITIRTPVSALVTYNYYQEDTNSGKSPQCRGNLGKMNDPRAKRKIKPIVEYQIGNKPLPMHG
jgi:hypothetical protein